jgi:polar amino acid transport system substrate-binding protein
MVAGLSLIRPVHAQEEVAPFRLCADPDNLPFSSTSEATPGFYIELGRDIAQALGRPFQPVWVPTYYTKRQVRLKMLAGQCDGFAGVPDDASFMGPRLIFSRPIVQLGYALVAPPAMGVTGVTDLRGHRVAVQWSSPPQDLLASENDVQTVTVLSPEEAMQDLRDNKVDAAFVWGATAGWLNTTVMHGAYRIVPVEGDHMQWSAAIAFPRDRTSLRDDVDRALTGLGTSINALAVRYGFPAASGTAATVAEPTTEVGTPASKAQEPTPAVASNAETSRPARSSSTRTARTVTDRTPFKASSAATYGCCGSVTARKCPRRSYSL